MSIPDNEAAFDAADLVTQTRLFFEAFVRHHDPFCERAGYVLLRQGAAGFDVVASLLFCLRRLGKPADALELFNELDAQKPTGGPHAWYRELLIFATGGLSILTVLEYAANAE